MTAVRGRALALAAVVVASAAVLVAVYLTQYRVDRASGPAAERSAVAAASSATATLLSYAPDTIEEDLAAAKSVMTGDFATYYGRFTADVVGPAARDHGVRGSARVVDAAAMEVHSDHATVLVFLHQETTSADRPEPALTASSVIVNLTRVDDRWLVSGFDPV
ncbi:hypothetical protein CRI77_16745 [Mycolicibacterium duvalii]|uniref:Uncharacterized protein n=1 Tax=Mycolicibacterium duvalii TaxID=39688 RepID=A0A7I7K382_9MYCO|nr:hypothetical protein [Mycolicibacterium duvalii]MCV7367408.1 hypothetical protein [Mycolicibacterium duvalii]PEG39272.1 hypothetical protein CRI77_16745 [Mycolicibacterium duvalii]BBX17832.1 hypothetical protein MDUV_26920 [Mycolicibacterium duvalii]